MTDMENGSSEGQFPASVISVVQAEHRFPGQWILMKVTDLTEADGPVSGIVVASESSRGKISAILAKVAPDIKKEGRSVYIFHAPPHSRIARNILGTNGASSNGSNGKERGVKDD